MEMLYTKARKGNFPIRGRQNSSGRKPMTTGFDIRGLFDLKPPQFMCQNCYALLRDSDISDDRSEKSRILHERYSANFLTKEQLDRALFLLSACVHFDCPVCGFSYQDHIEDPETRLSRLHEYFRIQKLTLEFDDLVQHAEPLAKASVGFQSGQPPLRALLTALAHARKFVHLVTWGISTEMIGTLKLTAQRVPVRGIVSGLDPTKPWDAKKIDELTKYQEEAPNLQIEPLMTAETWTDLPHQKVIVIDALITFKGSANLTLGAWRKVAKNYDDIEVFTELERVIQIHNHLFSPAWSQARAIGKGAFVDTGKIKSLD